MQTFSCVSVIVVLLGLFAGCGESSSSPTPAIPPPAPAPVTAADVTDADCQEFADRLIESIQNGDLPSANSQINWDLCFDRSLHGIKLSAENRAEAKRGLMILVGDQGMLSSIIGVIRQGGAYKFLRVHEVNGEKRVLFRLILPNMAVNYHDYMLTKDDSGTVRAYDVFVFLSGEPITETMRRLMLQLAVTENRSLLDRLAGREQLLIKHLAQWEQVPQSIQQGNPEAALTAYYALPEELQKEKFLLLLAMQAALHSNNNAKYQSILTTFRAAHPDDPAMNFVSIDYFAMRNEFDKALEAIDGLPDTIADDAYIDAVRAETLLSAKRFEAARKATDDAIAREPDLLKPYWTRVAITLEQRQFDETLKWLKTIDQKFEITWNPALPDPVYDKFRRSPQYREWQAYLNQ